VSGFYGLKLLPEIIVLLTLLRLFVGDMYRQLLLEKKLYVQDCALSLLSINYYFLKEIIIKDKMKQVWAF